MQTRQFTDLTLSRLMLGTVQLGLSYGIANKSGQPSYQEARDILACAYEGGVNCFDTAAGYGTSEEVLGQALAELGIADKVVIVTKIGLLAENLESPAVDAIVEESVTRSLKRLRIPVLPICLFHREENFSYIGSLLKLKERGLVRHVGSSTMTADATTAIINSGHAEALQIPTNVFDHRFTRSNITQMAAKRGIALFIRSIFLQGLLLLPEEEMLPELAPVIPVRRRLQTLANAAGMTLAELAVRYILSLDAATCALVGVETVEQMRENIQLFNRGPLPADLAQAVQETVPTLPDNVIMPNKWSKRMADFVPQRKPSGG